ncbi:MFS transporter [Massilia niastensis]|uniref:MFS transporter n=1 Tax=Massilia niastensis TaxID=544911 RepID=UPI001B7F9014|nr:MFS transporter [Massilia niastensis]
MTRTESTVVPAAQRILAPGVARREAWGWAMYDFANSSYTTVVITAIFNAYFVAVVAGGQAWATLAWTAALAVSNLLLMVIGPVLGAYADLHGNKKRLLLASTVGCVASTAALALAGPETLGQTMLLLVLSSMFFGIGENLSAAFLPELATDEHQGRLSGWGWSLGYLGGLLTLGLCLLYVDWAAARGQQAMQFVPVTMLITAAVFGTASVPTFLLLRERAQAQGSAAGTAGQAAARLLRTLRRARHYPDLRRFLLCIVVYQAGIQTVIALAAIYAQQALGFTTRDTVLLIIVVNVTAAVGAFAFGYIQDRIGHVATIAATLAGWILMTALAWLARGPLLFWIAANIAGLCLGASQSSARAFIGVLSPAARRAEFFGLWGMAVRLASIVGPLTYGLVSWLSQGDHRQAMLINGGFFLAGLLLLLMVDAERGKRAAQDE